MYANIAIQLVTFVSVGLKVVKSGGNIWGEEVILVFFGERVTTPPLGQVPGPGQGPCLGQGPDWEWSWTV